MTESGIGAELHLAEERQKEREEHFKIPGKRTGICPICGDDIGPGHSSRMFEGVSYCTSCVGPLAMTGASVKALAKKNDGIGPTTSEILEDVSSRGDRPPLKKLLPGMLHALGFEEIEGRWSKATRKPPEEQETTSELVQKRDKSTASDQKCPPADELITKYKNSLDSEEKLNAKATIKKEVARLEEVGAAVVPSVIAEELGYKISQVAAALYDMNYYQTETMDKKSYMMIWVKKGLAEPEVPDAKLGVTAQLSIAM